MPRKADRVPRRATVAGALAAVCLLLFPPLAAALDVPALRGRVNDYADMISPGAEARLEEELAALERTDSTQIVVLTVPSLEGDSLEEFSIRVAETWGIGRGDVDNGAVLVVSKADRAVRIEVGYGLEGVLTDLMSGRIVDYEIVPNFQAGRFDEGFLMGTRAMIETVRGEYVGTAAPESEEEDGGFSGLAAILPLLISYLIISVLGARKRILGGLAGAALLPLVLRIFFSVALPLLLFLAPVGFFLGLLISGLGRGARGRSRRPGGFGGFGGFGGGGFRGGGFGGGGGFRGGGGGFGGGGASGRW